MQRMPNKIIDMDDTQALLRNLALADREIETGEMVPIEEVMEEFGVEAPKTIEIKPK
jgi:hypothetical protein